MKHNPLDHVTLLGLCGAFLGTFTMDQAHALVSLFVEILTACYVLVRLAVLVRNSFGQSAQKTTTTEEGLEP